MKEVKIKRVHTVPPTTATWTGTLPLSEWDQAAGTAYVPYIYIYKNGGGDDAGRILKESLARCLVHFYPMAGRIRRVKGGRMEVECNGAGAVVIEAESEGEVGELGDFRESERFRELIYEVEYGGVMEEMALLYVQVTVFRCGGFSVGITMSHAVTDGMGGLHFTAEWARLARGESLERIPHLTREALRAGEPPRERDPPTTKPVVIDKITQPPPSIKETTMINLTLTKTQIQTLRKTANNNATHRPYTRYEILTTHIWRTATKARGHTPTQPTTLGFGMDARTRIRPPLPPNFWGNAVLMVVTQTKATDLISNPLGFGCGRVRATIERVDNDHIWSDIEKLKRVEDLSVWRGLPDPETGGYGYPDVMVISWLTLPVYGMDFGWGKEVHMGPATHTHDGTAMVLPGRAEEGEEDVVVAICLEVGCVERFTAFFYGDIGGED